MSAWQCFETKSTPAASKGLSHESFFVFILSKSKDKILKFGKIFKNRYSGILTFALGYASKQHKTKFRIVKESFRGEG